MYKLLGFTPEVILYAIRYNQQSTIFKKRIKNERRRNQSSFLTPNKTTDNNSQNSLNFDSRLAFNHVLNN